MNNSDSKVLTFFSKRPLISFLVSQLLMLILILTVLRHFVPPGAPWLFIFTQGFGSLLIAIYIFRLAKWWGWISVLMPLFIVTSFTQLEIPSWFYAFLFILFSLIFSHTLKERVPLYLTNNTTYDALNKFIADNNIKNVIDLGSGLGGVVRALASSKTKSFGVESAPLVWLSSFILSKVSGKGHITRQSIWDANLSNIDLAYAFLSPVPMEQLYNKVKKEMKPGSFLISNSFLVPNIKPDEAWELDDKRKTKLYIYKVG